MKPTTDVFAVTDIQIFDYKNYSQTNDDGDFKTCFEFSANIVINNLFIVQLGSDGHFDIPTSDECFWGSEDIQDHAVKNYILDDIIEQTGIRNDREYLIENYPVEIMFP